MLPVRTSVSHMRIAPAVLVHRPSNGLVEPDNLRGESTMYIIWRVVETQVDVSRLVFAANLL